MLSNEWGWSLVGENRAGESTSDASVKTGGAVDKVLAKAEKASKSRKAKPKKALEKAKPQEVREKAKTQEVQEKASRATYTEPHFNLLDEPFIPVVYTDNTEGTLSLKGVFAEAHRVKYLDYDSDVYSTAVIRLLLAVMYRAYNTEYLTRGKEDLMSLHRYLSNSEKFDNTIEEYLEGWRDRFDLFSDTYPFYQTVGLVKADKKEPYRKIRTKIAEVPKDEKFFFTDRSRQEAETIDFAEAANLLIYLQNYDVQGIHGDVLNDNGKPLYGKNEYSSVEPVVNKKEKDLYQLTPELAVMQTFYLEGETLYDTLVRNFATYDVYRGTFFVGNESDSAQWEEPAENFSRKGKYVKFVGGVADLFTLRNRGLTLKTTPDGRRVEGIVVTYAAVTNRSTLAKYETMAILTEDKTVGLKPLHQASLNGTQLTSAILPRVFQTGKTSDRRPKVVQFLESALDEDCYADIQEGRGLEKAGIQNAAGSFDDDAHPLRTAGIRSTAVMYDPQNCVVRNYYSKSFRLPMGMFFDYDDTQTIVEESIKLNNVLKGFSEGDRFNPGFRKLLQRVFRVDDVTERMNDISLKANAVFEKELDNYTTAEEFTENLRKGLRILFVREANYYARATNMPAFGENPYGRVLLSFYRTLGKVYPKSNERDEERN